MQTALTADCVARLQHSLCLLLQEVCSPGWLTTCEGKPSSRIRIVAQRERFHLSAAACQPRKQAGKHTAQNGAKVQQ